MFARAPGLGKVLALVWEQTPVSVQQPEVEAVENCSTHRWFEPGQERREERWRRLSEYGAWGPCVRGGRGALYPTWPGAP